MIGQQEEAAFSMAVAALVGLSTQLPVVESSLLNLLVANPLEGEAEAVYHALPEVLPVRLVAARDPGEHSPAPER